MTTANAMPQALQMACKDAGAEDPHLLRVRRLGRRLFDVDDCVIMLGDDILADDRAVGDWCRRTALDPDAGQGGASLSGAIFGAGRMRFFVSLPVHGPDGAQAGSIFLVDRDPRAGLGEDERGMLADLGALVERELELRSVHALQRDLQKKNKHLRRRSLVDPLLGTWNRGAIMRILNIEAERCAKAGLPLSLVVADLDFFKKINDTYGHPAGDTVLVKVASRLRSCIRPQDALGRYGGEEFLIVLPGSPPAGALQIAERMRAAVAARPEPVGEDLLQLTISAGVASTAIFPDAAPDDLISRADMALYVAKDTGRNRVVHAVPDLS